MIGPLAQRQVHVVSTVEALRQAHDISEQLQRELGKKRAADDRMAEAASEVPQISEAEAMRTEERQSRQKQSGHGRQLGDGGAAESEPEAEETAETADPHLDFLA